VTEIELAVDGMTCASCASRVERTLNKLAGVEATVNLATERAFVRYPDGVSPDDLVAAVAAAGYSADRIEPDRVTPGPEPAAAGPGARLLLALLLAPAVIVVSMVPAWQFDYWQWIAAAVTSVVVLVCGWPMHAAAARNLRHGTSTMDTLVSVGTLAALGWSLWALAGPAGMIGMTHHFSVTISNAEAAESVYFEVAAGVTLFLLVGRYAEDRATRRAGSALRALLDLAAKQVTLLPDGTAEGRQERVGADRLAVGDVFLVGPGESVATDGVVVAGASAVDASLLTGEPVPVEVGPGDTVTGATVNTYGRLVVRATRVGADTQLAQITRLVTQAQTGKAHAQRLADRVAGVFVPAVIALAVATGVVWLALGWSASAAFTAAAAVLIVACPCALGLAVPIALLVGTGRGAQLGILVRGPQVLESTRRADTVVLDKTGTVTTGRMTLLDTVAAAGADAGEVLRLAGAVEAASEHPIAVAVAAGAARRGPLPAVTDFAATPGIGAVGRVAGVAVSVGRVGATAAPVGAAAATAAGVPVPALDGRDGPVGAAGVELPAELAGPAAAAQALGRTVAAVGWDGRVRGLVVVADAIRPEAAQAVRELRALGLRPVLLTGDSEPAARAIAAEAGIEQVIAGVLPAGKVAAVEALKAGGHAVAFVGDGVNDAAALAGADLGIALGSGTDAAIAASDITLVRSDLRTAATAVRLARRTLRIVKQNLFWALAYNLAALPLAATGRLNPMVAGAAMALSSLLVVTNSLRLRRFDRASS
jgi:P-type Cu+ transporter